MIYTGDMNDGTRIFVFGSNLSGFHGAGAAFQAKTEWGAVNGVGVGRTGQAYAIPTKNFNVRDRLHLDEIQSHVDDFLRYAKGNPNLVFLVTKIGCGLAGYSDTDIAPMFRGAPLNCVLPEFWRNA